MEVSRKVMHRVTELLDDGRAFALCTVIAARGSVPGRVGAKMIVQPDGTQFGTVGGAGLEVRTRDLALKCLKEGRNATQRFDLAFFKQGGLDSLCGGTVDILVEVMSTRPHLLLCGGGHVALEVARLCDQLEYVFSVLDDRVEFATRERFPGARGLHVARPEDFFPNTELSIYSQVLVLGYSHQIDTEVLFQCVQRFPGYIGLICSRLKRKQMWKRLMDRGVSENAMQKVEAPVGVNIGAESPAEIAVSILGSIIREHKAKRNDEPVAPTRTPT
ncbi:MAG: XdhC/CoxI family protein [Deltaproteobacteria bacterium]|nr:XdhC/CoxI family protein [Deltaproteobacteria bacterium]